MIILQYWIFTSEIDIIEWDWKKFKPYLFTNNGYCQLLMLCCHCLPCVSPFHKNLRSHILVPSPYLPATSPLSSSWQHYHHHHDHSGWRWSIVSCLVWAGWVSGGTKSRSGQLEVTTGSVQLSPVSSSAAAGLLRSALCHGQGGTEHRGSGALGRAVPVCRHTLGIFTHSPAHQHTTPPHLVLSSIITMLTLLLLQVDCNKHLQIYTSICASACTGQQWTAGMLGVVLV